MLSAILCHPQQVLELDLYLSLLGDRIQNMVDRSQDPQEAANDLLRDLWQADLYGEPGTIDPREAGNRLITSNPGVEYRLSQWHLLPNPQDLPTELKVAREQISADRYDPASRLRSWAAALSRLP